MHVLLSHGVGDVFRNLCAVVLGGVKMLGLLVLPLQQEAYAAASASPFDWRNAEAALYCIR